MQEVSALPESAEFPKSGEVVRTVEIKLLRDEHGNVTQRVRIHLFVRDDNGAAQTPAGKVQTSKGALKVGGTKGYLACQKTRTDIGPQKVGEVIVVTPHSDDVRAATCPSCLETQEAKDMLRRLEELEPLPAN